MNQTMQTHIGISCATEDKPYKSADDYIQDVGWHQSYIMGTNQGKHKQLIRCRRRLVLVTDNVINDTMKNDNFLDV